MAKRLLALALALALLAGCAPAANVSQGASSEPTAVSSSLPDKEEEFQVLTHWDALESRGKALPDVEKLWPEGVSDTLIPRENYGPLVPYLGGTVYTNEWDGGGSLYGLMTLDGTVVTDAIYGQVSVPNYRDLESGQTTALPLLLLQKADPEYGWPSGGGALLAVCAQDGSWRTDFKWWFSFAGERGLMLFGANGFDLLGLDGTIEQSWTWEEVGLSGEGLEWELSWETVVFSPSYWIGDLVRVGYVDQERTRARLLDLTTGQIRPEAEGEWEALTENYYSAGSTCLDTYFDGENTVVRLEDGDIALPCGCSHTSVWLEDGLLFLYNLQEDYTGAAVYRLDGSPLVPPGAYDHIYTLRDETDPGDAFLLHCQRPGYTYDVLDSSGQVLFAGQDEVLSLFHGIIGFSSSSPLSCAEYYSLDTGELLLRRNFGLGSDQQEPWDDSMW